MAKIIFRTSTSGTVQYTIDTKTWMCKYLDGSGGYLHKEADVSNHFRAGRWIKTGVIFEPGDEVIAIHSEFGYKFKTTVTVRSSNSHNDWVCLKFYGWAATSNLELEPYSDPSSPEYKKTQEQAVPPKTISELTVDLNVEFDRINIEKIMTDWINENWPERCHAPIIQDNNLDNVNAPSHYSLIPEKNIEVIDVLDALGCKLDAAGVLTANETSYYMQALAYLMRFMDKNGLQDCEKAYWYIGRMIESMKTRNK